MSFSRIRKVSEMLKDEQYGSGNCVYCKEGIIEGTNRVLVNIPRAFPVRIIWYSAINSAYLTSQLKLPRHLMLSVVSYVCIGLCVVVIAFVVKIYFELPKLPKQTKKKEREPWY